MNTEGTAYGTISTSKGYFQAQGWDPITMTQLYLGGTKTKKEAQDLLNQFNFEFFSKHSNLLPRGISINRTRKTFAFTIPVKDKTQFMFHSRNLDEVMQEKLNFITKLI